MTQDLCAMIVAPGAIVERPVLVGMNNPLSTDPAHVLFPAPINCTGWRAWKMYHEARLAEEPGLPENVSKREYREYFDKRNVAPTLHWPTRTAERTALGRALMDELSGRTLLIFGVATLKALTLPRPASWFEWSEHVWTPDGVTRYALLPHPSGRCHEYNDPETRRRAGRLMMEVSR